MSKASDNSAEMPAFEEALRELEELVEELEQGDMNLADSLTKFERGVTLARQCQKTLSDAEQTITRLSSADETSSDEE